jgi:hypothetical protein
VAAAALNALLRAATGQLAADLAGPADGAGPAERTGSVPANDDEVMP